MRYEIFVKPDSGPCTVQERDSSGQWTWEDKAVAIGVANAKKKLYPHMDFLVH